MSGDLGRIFKVVLIGDGAVGKTSLRRNYLGKSFRENYLMTIGADFSVKQVPYEDYIVSLQIWDLAGQPRFSEVRGAYYANTYGAMVVFDVTRPNTFTNIDFWINEMIKYNDNKLIPLVIIGNKTDLRGELPEEVQVNKTSAMTYAQILSEWGGIKVEYVETSAKSGQNVSSAFERLIDRIYFQMGL
ncbi:MAG: GTP-binding protein [Candidatus Heimdallarchaeota archaeon]|nr:GTP-binding protein [Candidatus Heimdallarchaeota archaeon]